MNLKSEKRTLQGKKSSNAKRQKNKLLFLVGCPRSGTYLLMDILERHFDVCVMSETHFIPIFRKFLWLYGDLTIENNRERLLHSIIEFLTVWMTIETPNSDAIERLNLSPLCCSGLRKTIIKESYSYDSLIARLFQEFGRIVSDKNSPPIIHQDERLIFKAESHSRKSTSANSQRYSEAELFPRLM